MLVGIEGAHRNILKLRPPLVFSKANADPLVAARDRALGAILIGSVRSGSTIEKVRVFFNTYGVETC